MPFLLCERVAFGFCFAAVVVVVAFVAFVAAVIGASSLELLT